MTIDNRDGDKRPKRHAWAPGTYFCMCRGCKNNDGKDRQFVGDKQAIMCADCAYALPDVAVPLRPLVSVADGLAGYYYTLDEIENLCNGDRTTVTEANAFEEFSKLNRILVEVRSLARKALGR